MAMVDMDEGAVIKGHSHPHGRISCIGGGTLRITVGGMESKLTEGRVAAIPGGVPRSAAALEGPVRAVDSFSPRRDDSVVREEE